MSTSSPLKASVSPKLKSIVALWPSFLTTYLMSIIFTYLTGIWEISITRAAAIVNIYWGAVGIMPAVMKLLVDDFIGGYGMVLLSRLAFVAVLSLLTMSAPPVLGWATGTCTAYEAEFIALVQRMLFCTSLPLIAVGVSAYYASTLTLIGYKLQSQWLPSLSSLSASEPLLLPAASQSDYACTGNAAHWTLWTLFENLLLALLVVFLPGTAIIAVGCVSSWWIKFAIPAVVSFVSTIILLTDSSSSYKREQGGLDLLTDLTAMYMKIDIESVLLAIPMCINFIVLGVISSIGNTFFIEQAVDMNHYVGSLWFPILILPGFQGFLNKNWGLTMKCCPKVPKNGIAISMVFATLCYITAANVETRRLSVVESESFRDDPTSIIPMTMFWLVPQYILLGLTEALSNKSIADFFSSELLFGASEGDVVAKESKQKYIEIFARAVNGVGIVGGVLVVYIVDELEPTWFQSTVNRSRLDNYYWILAALSAANLVLFGFVSFLYNCKHRSEDVEDNKKGNTTLL